MTLKMLRAKWMSHHECERNEHQLRIRPFKVLTFKINRTKKYIWMLIQRKKSLRKQDESKNRSDSNERIH